MRVYAYTRIRMQLPWKVDITEVEVKIRESGLTVTEIEIEFELSNTRMLRWLNLSAADADVKALEQETKDLAQSLDRTMSLCIPHHGDEEVCEYVREM